MLHSVKRQVFSCLSILVAAGLLVGCSFQPNFLGLLQPTQAAVVSHTDQNIPLATVTFRATEQSGMPAGDITVEILDEVTGLALNPQRIPLKDIGSGQYEANVNFPIGTVVKYRYLRGSSPYYVEYTASGKQVRYRMVDVTGPQVVNDIISAWTDFQYQGPTGRITGQVFNPDTNAPYPDALVLAGGMQTLTASDGSFLLEGLPPGVHNLVIYSLDGTFKTFQQGAMVAENATTPAVIKTSAAQYVNVTFQVTPPAGNVKGLPIRIVGNLYSLGNTYADAEGGMSVIAARAPLMAIAADGSYSLTLQLPVGFDLRYKYTLGDGFWNAEHTTDGLFATRQLIVPSEDTTITNSVTAWASNDSSPITFIVKVPADTRPEDTVSIQFNPFGWTNPIPMWPLGNNQWLFVLYSPLNMVNNLGYRYCRNDQCGVADDTATAGADAAGRALTVTQEGQTLNDEIQSWVGWSVSQTPTTVTDETITPRSADFVTGVEIAPSYSPVWQPYMFWGFNKMEMLGANTAILSPTWSYTHAAPPVIEPVPGKDELWFDITQSIQTARQNNLNPILFPRLSESEDSADIWASAGQTPGWWDNWFERYKVFAVNFADVAAQTNVSAIILGGPEVSPALPGGKLADGSPSGVPADAADKWADIIATIRQRYQGKIIWALPYPWPVDSLPQDLLSSVDEVYVLFSPELSPSSSPTQDELVGTIGTALDGDINSLYQQINKPVLLGVDYPSTNGAYAGCVPTGDACISFEALSSSQPVTQTLQVVLQAQVNIYNAFFQAVGTRDWLAGFVSRGFYNPVAIQDASPSIYGKPAADVVGYWFPKLLGK